MVLHLFAGLRGKRETGFGTEHKYHHRCPQILILCRVLYTIGCTK